MKAQPLTQYKRFAFADINVCFAKTSLMLGTLYEIVLWIERKPKRKNA